MTDRIDPAVVPATGVVGRREFVASFAAGVIAMLATSKVVAQDALALHDLPFGILSRIFTAYIYGYAPVAAWATERIQTAVPDANTVGGRAPVNQSPTPRSWRPRLRQRSFVRMPTRSTRSHGSI